MSVTQAAKILQKNRQTVEKACRRLHVKKDCYGYYDIDNKTLELLRSTIMSVGQSRKNR